jgi:ribosome modulation factor
MSDGPLLPIEFARESADGRITLVLCEGVQKVRACWSILSVVDVSVGIEALAEREGIKLNIAKNIGWWNSVDGKSRGMCAAEIEAWAKEQWLDGVVWTNLPSGMKDSRGVMPTQEDVLAHIATLTGEQRKNALDYVMKAPMQVDTHYRRAIEQAFLG